MNESVLERTTTDVFQMVLQSVTDPLVVTSSGETVEDLVTAIDAQSEGSDAQSDGSVRLLAPDAVLTDVMEDFLVASVAADLVEAERLEIRTVDTVSRQLVVAADSVVALVTEGERAAGLRTDDEEFVASAVEHYADLWETADEFTLRTPPISHIQNTLEEQFGPSVASDFDGVLDALETARGDDDGLDEVTISLLVAAKHEELFYDISRWAEDVGLASKATFSRTKNRLETLGLIDTEKVPIDLGRPRQRLLLGDDRLLEAESANLATTAQSIISTGGNISKPNG